MCSFARVLVRQGLAERGDGSLKELHLQPLEVRLQRLEVSVLPREVNANPLEVRLLKLHGAPKVLEARHRDLCSAIKSREVHLPELYSAARTPEARHPNFQGALTRLEVRLLLSHRTLMGLNDAHKKHLRAVEALAVERWQSGCMRQKLSEWV